MLKIFLYLVILFISVRLNKEEAASSIFDFCFKKGKRNGIKSTLTFFLCNRLCQLVYMLLSTTNVLWFEYRPHKKHNQWWNIHCLHIYDESMQVCVVAMKTNVKVTGHSLYYCPNARKYKTSGKICITIAFGQCSTVLSEMVPVCGKEKGKWLNSFRLAGGGIWGGEGEVSQHGRIWQQAVPAWHLRGSEHAASTPYRNTEGPRSSGREKERETKRGVRWGMFVYVWEKQRDRESERKQEGMEAKSAAPEFSTTGNGKRVKTKEQTKAKLQCCMAAGCWHLSELSPLCFLSDNALA